MHGQMVDAFSCKSYERRVKKRCFFPPSSSSERTQYVTDFTQSNDDDEGGRKCPTEKFGLSVENSLGLMAEKRLRRCQEWNCQHIA